MLSEKPVERTFMKKKKPKARIGCSGFSYAHWKGGVFYPPGLSQRKWLEYYAEKFTTVELNVTFYRLPEASTFLGWAHRTPPGFMFAVKGSKLITHLKRLSGINELVEQFLERANELGDKLGPVLWQMPPKQNADRDLLKSFIKVLARNAGLRHAFEFRHQSWFVEPVYDLVREAGMSVVSADYAQGLPEPPLDFSFLYIRRHGGSRRAVHGSYPDRALAEDAKVIKKALREMRDVFMYFNNDIEGHAPANAASLIEML